MTDRTRSSQYRTPASTRTIRESTRRYFGTLFDFSFTRFITVQMFPVLYGVILAASLIGAIYLTIEAFFTGWVRGLFYLFIAAPIGFITIAHFLSQPWRGIIDIGVVVGLLWGVVALLIFTVQAFAGRLDASPMMP